MLKLPRTNLKTDDLAVVEAFLKLDLRPLVKEMAHLVSYLPFSSELAESLRITSRTGRLSQGLEGITQLLDDEKKGLTRVQNLTQQPTAHRMSRLLFVSNDGSERFYRQVASLLGRHGDRVWCCRVDTTAGTLGTLLRAQGNPAKAILIGEKKAIASFLTEMARRLPRHDSSTTR